jgi:hypothetical protein
MEAEAKWKIKRARSPPQVRTEKWQASSPAGFFNPMKAFRIRHRQGVVTEGQFQTCGESSRASLQNEQDRCHAVPQASAGHENPAGISSANKRPATCQIKPISGIER